MINYHPLEGPCGSTFGVDSKVQQCTLKLQDRHLLAKLSAGDLTAQGAWYYLQCLLATVLISNADVGSALNKACENDTDNDVFHLARAANIVRRDMFKLKNQFNSSIEKECQKESRINASSSHSQFFSYMQ